MRRNDLAAQVARHRLHARLNGAIDALPEQPPTPTYVVDLDRTSMSRGLVNRFAGSRRFEVAGSSASLDAANDALLRGDVTMVMAIPHGFETSIVRTGGAAIELSLNAEKGSIAGIVQSYAATIVAAIATRLTDRDGLGCATDWFGTDARVTATRPPEASAMPRAARHTSFLFRV